MKIKIRAWHKTEKKYYECHEIDYLWRYVTQFGTHKNTNISFNHVILEQYTGLKDINGVDVYKGDIVQHKLFKDDVGYIDWNDKNASFQLKGVSSSSMRHIPNKYRVIGNINENKELLNG